MSVLILFVGIVFSQKVDAENRFFTSKKKKLIEHFDFIVRSDSSIYYVKNRGSVALKSRQDHFTIDFSNLDCNIENSKYILEGYDLRYKNCPDDESFIEYTKVPAGNYKFILMVDDDHSATPEKIQFQLTVRHKWNETLGFGISAIALLIIMVALLVYLRAHYVRRKLEMEKKYLEYEKQMYQLRQKSLQLQTNPHTVFNILNSIQNFILNNQTDSAVHYLSRFSMLMRQILNNSNEDYITLNDELTAIKLYLELESLRFEGKFKYNIIIDNDIDENYVEIPPMILQPYVENAIIHGLIPKEGEGLLTIRVSNENDEILCVIEDNGIGIKRSEELQNKAGRRRGSYGMKITNDRLEMLNQYTEDHYLVKIINLQDDNQQSIGTRVEVRIRIKE